MIPNLDQLLIVCGIAIAVVAGIVWLLIKLPLEDDEQQKGPDE
ncbi:hypothetical protein [Glaciecola sp. SC05]